jgi:hypothetical protein
MCAVGRPIQVAQVARHDPGFEAAVDAAHGAFIEAMQDLCNRHKGKYGWASRPLVIV